MMEFLENLSVLKFNLNQNSRGSEHRERSDAIQCDAVGTENFI
jgi:hypothetical protein